MMVKNAFQICFATALLLGNDLAAAEKLPNLVTSVSFSYEGHNSLTGSPLFADGKTDYFWGEVQSVGTRLRYLGRTVTQTTPGDTSLYTTTETERYALDDGTILLSCQHSVDIRASSPLKSLKDAKALFSQRDKNLDTMWYFKSVNGSLQNTVLRGYSFLGMTPDGHLSTVNASFEGRVDGRDIYAYISNDKVKYRYEYNPSLRLFTRYSIVSAPSAQNSFHVEGSLAVNPSAGDEFILRITSRADIKGDNPYEVTEEQKIFDLRFDDITPLVAKFVPNEGERIDSLDTPQIRYEWRDGHIAKKIDELPDAGFEYGVKPKRYRWLIGVNVVVVLFVLVLIYLRGHLGR